MLNATCGVLTQTLTTYEWLAVFISSRTYRSWSVPGLSTRERAYLALTADVAQQTLGARSESMFAWRAKAGRTRRKSVTS